MNKVIPKIMPGFMELLPDDQILFNGMMDKIKKVYEKYGFLPIDTPVLEYSDILLAKAGGETEKQVYRFKKGDTDISMRFDLTVPLARYVSLRKNDLIFPFKRYQIGKVYRGERSQKGRYREFYQCDIDVIDECLNPLYEAEIPVIIYDLFKELNIGKFTIKVNNRKLLNGFFENLGLENLVVDIIRIIDKIDKIGKDNVIKQLKDLSIDENKINKILDFISIKGSNKEIIDALKNLNIKNDTFNKGLTEIIELINNIKSYEVDDKYFIIDLTIARGFDYYTGTIYETFLDDYLKLGSICSGGRYDNLTKFYSDQNLQGVGISIGLTRLFFQLKDAGIIKSKSKSLINTLIIPLDKNNLNYSINVSKMLREKNIKCDIYYDDKKIKNKLNYANRLKVPFVILIGEDEEKQNEVTIKNMETGEQTKVLLKDIYKYFE